jgi:C4-dicarboxylate transporter, DctQ subunit
MNNTEATVQTQKKSLTISGVIEKIYEAILGYGILLMALILIGNVISRTVLGASWSFAEEVGQSLLVIVTFVGVAYCSLKAKHINMSAVYDLVPRNVKKIMMILNHGITATVMLYLAYLGMEYTLRVEELGRVTPALRIPSYILCGIVAAGLLLTGIEHVRTFIKNLTNKEIYLSPEVTEGSDNGESLNTL